MSSAAANASVEQLESYCVILYYFLNTVCVVAGTIAAYWNIPVLSYDCIQRSLAVKSTYPTTIRLAATAGKFVEALGEMLNAYNWDEVFLLYAL